MLLGRGQHPATTLVRQDEAPIGSLEGHLSYDFKRFGIMKGSEAGLRSMATSGGVVSLP